MSRTASGTVIQTKGMQGNEEGIDNWDPGYEGASDAPGMEGGRVVGHLDNDGSDQFCLIN